MKNTVQGWNAIYKTNFGRQYPFEPLIVYVQRLKTRGFNGQRALDVGFGTIADLLMLHQSGYNVYGIEVAENALVKADEALTRLGVPHQLDLWIPGTPFCHESGFFDLVVALGSLHYNLDQDSIVREIARVTRPGGRFMATYTAPGCHTWKFTEVVRPGIRRYTDCYPNKDIVGVEFVSFEIEQDIQSIYERHFTKVEVSRYYYRLLEQDTDYWLVTGCAK